MTNYQAQQVWPPFSESLLDWDEAFHDLMLGDRLRMTAYRKAIFEAVRPGDVVLDLGTGTGILSEWALEAGAQRVFGVDLSAPILAHATERIRAAGFADRFEPINALSYDVQLPQRVDVLISEIIGNLADNEDFQPILRDAIARLVKPGGVILPRTTTSYLVPVAAEVAHRDLRAGKVTSLAPKYEISGLYHAKGIGSPFNLYYDCILPANLYLSRPEMMCSYQGAWDQPATYERTLTFSVGRNGTFTGFKGYFVAALTQDTSLDISGGDIEAGQTSDSWKHAYLPIAQPLEAREGDALTLTFSRHYPNQGASFRQIYRWRGHLERNGAVVGRFDQCMDEGLLSEG
jgi:type I protein arginine methyltransferase